MFSLFNNLSEQFSSRMAVGFTSPHNIGIDHFLDYFLSRIDNDG